MTKDYLPDEYQYPAADNAGGGDTFELEATSKDRTPMERKAGKDLDPELDPALSRFYLRDPMKMTKKIVKVAVDTTMVVVDAGIDATTVVANAGIDAVGATLVRGHTCLENSPAQFRSLPSPPAAGPFSERHLLLNICRTR